MESTVVIEAKKKKLRDPSQDRTFVALSKDVAAKVTKHLDEACQALKGVTVSRSEFVCWILERGLERLGKEDSQNFKIKFQNEEGRLKWASQELKRRREAGENPTLEEILKGESAYSKIEKRPRKKKDPKTDTKSETSNADLITVPIISVTTGEV